MAGNSNSGKRKDRQINTALNIVLKAGEAEGRGVQDLMQVLVNLAFSGDLPAIKEINDRLDGKPAQAIIGGDDDDNPINLIHRIERVIVNAKEPT